MQHIFKEEELRDLDAVQEYLEAITDTHYIRQFQIIPTKIIRKGHLEEYYAVLVVAEDFPDPINDRNLFPLYQNFEE